VYNAYSVNDHCPFIATQPSTIYRIKYYTWRVRDLHAAPRW